MAQEVQSILIKYEADIKALRKDLDQTKAKLKEVDKEAGRSSKAVSNAFKKVGVAIAAAFSVQVVKSFAIESAKLADKQLKAEAQLLTSLKGRKDAQQELIKQAAELQKVTTFGDEETILAQSRIAAFVQETDQIKELTRVSQDFAAAKGVDLASAADLITKTFASSTNALGRYGLEVEGAANSNERLTSLVAALDGAFKGQAETLAQVGLGPLQQVQNAFGDLQEEIGFVILEQLPRFTEQLGKATEASTDFVRQLAGVDERTGSIGAAAQFVSDRFAEFEQRIRDLIAPTEGALKVLINIGQRLGLVSNSADAGAKAFDGYTKALELTSRAFTFFSDVILGVVGTINGLVNVIGDSASGIRDFFSEVGEAAELFAQGKFRRAADAIKEVDFTPDFGKIKTTFLDGLTEITSINDPEAKQEVEEAGERAGIAVGRALEGPMGKAGKKAGEVLLTEFTKGYRQALEDAIAFRRDFEALDDGFLFNTSNLDAAWTDYRAELLDKFDQLRGDIEDFNEDAEDLRVLGMPPEQFNAQLEGARDSALDAYSSIAMGFSQVSGDLTGLIGAEAERSKSLATFQILLSQSVALARSIEAAATLKFPANIAAIVSSIAAITGFFAQVKALNNQAQVPAFAEGTSSAPGGMSLVGEEGPELMYVPKGARIFTSDATKRERGLIDAINAGKAGAFIEETYVNPALSTFAENISRSATQQLSSDELFYIRQAIKANKTVELGPKTRRLFKAQQPRFH